MTREEERLVHEISKHEGDSAVVRDKLCYDRAQETLRDRFAMAALTGLLTLQTGGRFGIDKFNLYAFMSYDIADAMMKAREGK